MSNSDGIQKVVIVQKSNKSFGTLLLWWLLLGYVGAHRWYAGRGSWGYTLTIGWFMIGYFIDFFVIISGNFKDEHGLPIKRREKYVER